jgi:23S rRNA (guanine2069-N7)-methyltransferase / 23S rRNA (guanine2445-N2)-methyltransferase
VQFFASCPPGVADLTAAELRACGATNTRELKLGVLFEGTLETAYRACLWSRTASRILMPLGNFPAATPEELYAGVAAIDWTHHLAPNGSLAIEFGGSSAGIKHTHFGALKTKDAIVDQLRERTGQRPSVELEVWLRRSRRISRPLCSCAAAGRRLRRAASSSTRCVAAERS